MIRRPHEPCGYCGNSKLRRAFKDGGGKRSHRQHPHKFKCENGHLQWRKNK